VVDVSARRRRGVAAWLMDLVPELEGAAEGEFVRRDDADAVG